MNDDSFFTLSVHAGEDRSAHFGAVSVPIYPASVFAFEDADEGIAIHNYEKDGYFYGRLGNPTVDALERTVAELENGEAGLAFASGMATNPATYSLSPRARSFHTITIAMHRAMPIMINPIMYSGLSERKATASPNIKIGPMIQF